MTLTVNDYMSVISEMSYKSISQGNEESVRRSETEAREEISGYLRPVYDVEKIFSAEGEERNPQIVMLMTDITLYHLSASSPQKMGVEVRKERYERSIKWLEGVQSGKIVPDIPRVKTTDSDGNTSDAGVLIYGSNTKLHHDW